MMLTSRPPNGPVKSHNLGPLEDKGVQNILVGQLPSNITGGGIKRLTGVLVVEVLVCDFSNSKDTQLRLGDLV